MLIKQETLRGIAAGTVTLAFRRWRKPTVKAGGTLLTAVGQLAIEGVDPVSIEAVTEQEARAAGFAQLDELIRAVSKKEGQLYRVALRLAGPDPRVALREEVPANAAAFAEIESRLARWDRASRSGAWTQAVLEVISERPGIRAGDLAEHVGMEKASFKVNVRKLKGLGLTESLEVGYRLSSRGAAVLQWLSR